MAQFDIFANPLLSARRAYPFVVAMQSDFAAHAIDQIVAPLAPKDSMLNLNVVGRLTPAVVVNGAAHFVIVPRMTAMRSRDLGKSVSSVATARADILAAIDYLFFGI